MLQPMIRSFNLMGDNGEPFIAELGERWWQAPNDTWGPLKPLIAACNFPISLQKWWARPRGWAGGCRFPGCPAHSKVSKRSPALPQGLSGQAAKELSHCPCLYLNPDQGPPSLPHPTAYVALGMEGVCRYPRTPHPVTTLRHHHCWPFCNLLPTSTLPVSPMNPPWSLSKDSVHRFPRCQLHQSRRLPRLPHHHVKSPHTEREEGDPEILLVGRWRAAGDFIINFFQAWDPSLLLSGTKPWGDQCLGLWPPKASDPPTAERIPGAQDNGLLKPQKVAQCCIVCVWCGFLSTHKHSLFFFFFLTSPVTVT